MMQPVVHLVASRLVKAMGYHQVWKTACGIPETPDLLRTDHICQTTCAACKAALQD